MKPNPVSPQNVDLSNSMSPVSTRKRIGEIDVLRGWAIFGMLLVNTGSLGGDWLFPERWTGLLDNATATLVSIMAEDKFSTLFAFLFGLGFTIQMWRADTGGGQAITVYMRRLIVLLFIGFATLVFIAPVFILQNYALLGFVLLLFRNVQSRTLVRIAFVCLLIPFATEAVMSARTYLDADHIQIEQQVAVEDNARASERAQRHQERIRLHTEGSYRDLLDWRTRSATGVYSRIDYYVVNLIGTILPIFLLGLWAGRQRIFEHLHTRKPFVRRVLWSSMAIGFAGTLASFAMRNWIGLERPLLTEPLATLLWNFGRTGLCFFYAAGLVLLLQRQYWKRRLTPLAAVGRMALTNYLLQLIVFAVLFPAYGLGMFGRIGPALGIALTIIVFGVQVIFSIWWVRRYRFGPAEWLWRCLTYGKLLPIRYSAQAPH